VKSIAEWEAQKMVFVALPHAGTDWAAYLDDIWAGYRELIAALAKFQSVGVITPRADDFERVCGDIARSCERGREVRHFDIATNDTWVRDYVAIGVRDGSGVVNLDFKFNAWGGKFESTLDDAVNSQLFADMGGCERVDMILEGGSVDFNGAGVMLTTEACLLNANRGARDKATLEARLCEIFGLSRIIWLRHGAIIGDDTDSHIDTLARFITPDTIAFAACDDPDDPHYEELGAMRRELEATGYNLVPLPIPAPKFYGSQRLGCTYTNFVFVNGGLIVPTYGDAHDETALSRLAEHLPSREIIGVNSLAFVRQNGSLHCSTQNLFKGIS